jgi:hypothetical protein
MSFKLLTEFFNLGLEFFGELGEISDLSISLFLEVFVLSLLSGSVLLTLAEFSPSLIKFGESFFKNTLLLPCVNVVLVAGAVEFVLLGLKFAF